MISDLLGRVLFPDTATGSLFPANVEADKPEDLSCSSCLVDISWSSFVVFKWPPVH
jgi:hypothetical protein